MMAVSLAPFVVLIGLAIWGSMRHGFAFTSGGAPPERDIAGALLVTLWNYMGWDNASTIAQEVENPQRNYPRAMFTSALAVMCVYTLPLAAVWMAGIPAARFSTGAWVDAAALLGGSALAICVVLAGSLDGLGTFNALTLSLTRLPYAMAEDGLLPKILAKRWSNGVPWVSVLACSVGWALALTFTFERLISIDLVLYGGALILEFVALVVLRLPGAGADETVPGAGRVGDRESHRAGADGADRVCAVGCAGGTGGRTACAGLRGAGCGGGSAGVHGGAAGYPLPPYLIAQSIQ